MRISDWSSDVCSSDLADAIEIGDDPAFAQQPFVKADRLAVQVAPWPLISKRELQVTHLILERPVIRLVQGRKAAWNFARSEERRVGKECISTCRSRWYPYH